MPESRAVREQGAGHQNTPPRKVRRGEYVPRSTETSNDFAATWLASRQRDALAPSTRAQYERNLRRHVRPHLGGERTQRIDTPRIERLYDGLHRAGVGHGALQSVHTLQQVFRPAAKQKIIVRETPWHSSTDPRLRGSPGMATRTNSPGTTFGRRRSFAGFSVWRRDSPFYPLFRLAATTDMRRGELCGLRWQDVDLGGAALEVRQQYADALGGGQEFRRLKSKAARRRIDLDATTAVALRDHRRAQLETRL